MLIISLIMKIRHPGRSLTILSAGIKAIDIIDFDYTYWHTVHDTADKVAPESLKTVGDVLLEWLTNDG